MINFDTIFCTRYFNCIYHIFNYLGSFSIVSIDRMIMMKKFQVNTIDDRIPGNKLE